MLVFLTGATGFVGGHLLKRLLAERHNVRALVRDPAKAKLPGGNQIELVQGDIVDETGLDSGMKSCDAVINLVGIIVETGKNTFERVHHIGTRNVVEAAQRNKISRFIQMSALGVRADGVSEYQITKWKGEEAVRQGGIPYCILRPSLIFGPGSGFVSEMLDIMRKAPLFRPVPGNGKPRFRPIFVEDVAACFTQALTNPAATNKTIELCGGEELSLDQVLQEIADCAGIRKRAIHVPMAFMFPAAAVAQTLLPRPPVTVGQLRMLKEGSTCDIGPMVQTFGFTPAGFRSTLKAYLSISSG
ncbi:MAG TPA: complex I NDUFA9 subunit family protein [Candidatus Angelobacter sp.]|nr:complex I NDUFA9 subunit family protein [Candidatus Angelobacter sp.]